MKEKEKRKLTIEGLTQLRNIMFYMSKDHTVYIYNAENFIEALDNALEILGE